MAAIESLLALPIVLLAGLSILQAGLVLHARQSVMHAATESVRAGAVGFAAPAAIERGFALGLTPWFLGSTGAADHQVNVTRTLAHLAQGQAQGWMRWRQLSPTAASFRDWGVAALDGEGLPMPDVREIPTDNLVARARLTEPASGRLESPAAAGAGAPVGADSGQSLSDASLLKVEFTYGVPLTVPVVGRLGAWVMSRVDGCEAADEVSLGLIRLGRTTTLQSRPWACAFYAARDASGRWQPRWPVRVAALARLQTPARHAGADAAAPPLAAASPGAGRVDDRPAVPTPVEELNPGGVPAESDGSSRRGEGFLELGGDGRSPAPEVCLPARGAGG